MCYIMVLLLSWMLLTLICIFAEGVQHLHKHGIAHRDLKPSNIMFKNQSDDSPVKIIDYDLAKANYSTAWYGGTPVGTTDFMAPEVVQKQRYRKTGYISEYHLQT